MCLSALSRKKWKKKGFGYKVFWVLRDELYNPILRTGPMQRGRWLNEERFRRCYVQQSGPFGLSTYDGASYPLGFHLFLKRGDAKVWMEDHASLGSFGSLPNKQGLKIYKVKYKRAVAAGYIMGRDAVVAQQILIEDRKGGKIINGKFKDTL